MAGIRLGTAIGRPLPSTATMVKSAIDVTEDLTADVCSHWDYSCSTSWVFPLQWPSVHCFEPHPHAEHPPLWRLIGKVWRHGLIVCLQGIGFAAIGAFFALYFLHHDWPHGGLDPTAFVSGFVLVRIFLGRLPDRLGGLRVAIGSLLIEAIEQFLIWYAHDSMLALVGAFLTGLGCSRVFPAMGREVVHLAEPHLRGTALGGYAAFQNLAYGVTGALAGLRADRVGYGSIFLIGGMVASTGFLISLYLPRASAQALVR